MQVAEKVAQHRISKYPEKQLPKTPLYIAKGEPAQKKEGWNLPDEGCAESLRIEVLLLNAFSETESLLPFSFRAFVATIYFYTMANGDVNLFVCRDSLVACTF